MKAKNETSATYTPDSDHASKKAFSITCSRDIRTMLTTYADKNYNSFGSQEYFVVIAMNNKNEVLADPQLINLGTGDQTLVDVAAIFRFILSLPNCNRFACVHNHPSNDCMPSHEDRAITQRIKKAGALFGIELLDHIIIAGNLKNHASMRDLGVF